jgi:hypothetical protein
MIKKDGKHCEHEEIRKIIVCHSNNQCPDKKSGGGICIWVCTRDSDNGECTHDTRQHNPSTVVEDITFEGAAIVQAARKEAAAKAREEVLDEICAINKEDGCCDGNPHGKDCFDCAFIPLRSEVKKE